MCHNTHIIFLCFIVKTFEIQDPNQSYNSRTKIRKNEIALRLFSQTDETSKRLKAKLGSLNESSKIFENTYAVVRIRVFPSFTNLEANVCLILLWHFPKLSVMYFSKKFCTIILISGYFLWRKVTNRSQKNLKITGVSTKVTL